MIVDSSVHDRLLPKIVAAVEAQVTGDPADDATDVGPLVDEAAAKRVESWVDEAVEAGATLLTGGKREGATYAPPSSPASRPTSPWPAPRSSARS